MILNNNIKGFPLFIFNEYRPELTSNPTYLKVKNKKFNTYVKRPLIRK